MTKPGILIVEDEHIVALDIERSLTANGYQVVGKTDRGEDAVQKAKDLQPDLILMDIHLRGDMDGVEAACQIREKFELPVIFLTAFSNPTTLQLARRAEPFAYVLKPFIERELVGNIEMSLYKHNMERKLRESEARFRRLASNAPDIIFRYEFLPSMQLAYISPAIQTILGYAPEECYANPGIIIGMLQLDMQEADAGLSKLQDNSNHHITVRCVTKAGQIRWLESRIVSVLDEYGQMVAIEGVTRDISQQKKIEANMEKLIYELSAKNQELDQFTYTVSHDLKSPLITIRGFLNYLEKDAFFGDTEKMRTDIMHISNATEKMQTLLNELLELSHIGKIIDPSEEVSFETVVQDALSRVSSLVDQRGARISIVSHLPAVYGDYTRLVQAVQNILENAIKFMGDQTDPRVEIGIRDDMDPNWVTFYVKDNGVGIKPKFHTKIFGLFEKLEAASPGTGIGLTLVKKIIDSHAGRIWVESDGETGTTFLFTLPKYALVINSPTSGYGNPPELI